MTETVVRPLNSHSDPESRPKDSAPPIAGWVFERSVTCPNSHSRGWQHPVRPGRFSPLHHEASPIPVHPGTKLSNPQGSHLTTVYTFSPSPLPAQTHTPPAASPASRMGPGVEESEFSLGFIPVMKEASFPLQDMPKKAREATPSAGCGMQPSRGRSKLHWAPTWKPVPTFPLDLSLSSLSQNNLERMMPAGLGTRPCHASQLCSTHPGTKAKP